MMQIHTQKKRGFTLIEILVAVAVFSVVMMVAVGSLLTIAEANRKAQSIKAITDNIAFALESISRSARVGTTYHCEEDSNPTNVDQKRECGSLSNPGLLFAFEPFDGISGDPDDQWVYRLNGTQLERSTDGGATFIALTSPEVSIDRFDIYTNGIDDNFQPIVTIWLEGTASTSPRSTTKFRIQTSFTQRLLDL